MAATPSANDRAVNPDGKFGIPGGAEVWAAPDGYWYVVYKVPGTGTPLGWRIENDNDVAAIFGPDNEQKPDRTLSADEWGKAGLLLFGPSRQLANTSEHPFDAFASNFDTEAKVRPWLKDEEVLALTTRAILEGRTVTDAELAETKWWQGRTAGERAWIAEYNRDPATAKQKVQDGQDRIRQLMMQSGIANPPDQLVELVGNRMTAGTWSQAYAQSQVVKLADPYAAGTLDTTLATWVQNLANGGTKLNTLAENTSKVDQLVRTWLGPALAQTVTPEEKAQWAGRLRNDPQAEEEVTKELKRRRVANFGEFPDENLSYNDIASTAKGAVQQMWGQPADETDPFFLQLVRLSGSAGTKDEPGGLAGVQTALRTEGLKRGIGTVVNQGLATLNMAFGGSQRRTI